jgi:hypothetical protein
MENFRANLAHYRLPLVVPALFDGKQLTATMRVERGAVRRVFCFRDGNLVGASSNDPREHLAQVLCDLNLLDLTRSAEAFGAAHRLRRVLGAFLLERGFVDKAGLEIALAHKAREAFYDCYVWESGELEIEWSAPPEEPGVTLCIPLGALHGEALERLREWKSFRSLLPSNDTSFRVHRRLGGDWRSEDEERLLGLAERGATLGELLASGPEGALPTARRITRLFRRGVLSPRAQGAAISEAADVAHLMELTRTFLSRGQYEAAAAVAGQALETAAVPEAAALYREAEAQMGRAVSEEVRSLEGRLRFEPPSEKIPPELTADDLYLFALLRQAGSVREAVGAAAMGELAAYRSVRKLLQAGYLKVEGPTPPQVSGRPLRQQA